jgi:hypothetical protein
MPRPRLSGVLVILCALAALPAAALGSGALVEVDNVVLRANGGFVPRSLPKHRFTPIDFQGHLDLSGREGGGPPALEQIVLDFDRDGRLSANGLPTCAPEQVANLGVAEARQACRGAIVGTGHIDARVAFAEGPLTGGSPVTIFNGPILAGKRTVLFHAHAPAPIGQTFAILIPIERRRGDFRYRATLDLPPIAEGLGAITHIDVKIGRRFSAGGKRRSYVSARCSDSVLRTHGRFTFSDGTIIDGSVEVPCTAR